MSNRVSAKLYKIKNYFVDDSENSEILIDEMVENYYFKNNNHKFKEVKLKEHTNAFDYKSKLYIYHTNLNRPSWLNFLNTIVEEEESLIDLESKYSAFVLFIYNKENIYAISKGYYGRHLMGEYLDDYFGLDVLSRLVDKNLTEIRKIEERGVFGAILGSQKYFREDYKLSYEDDFGKIYKTILASIDEQVCEKLGIENKNKKFSKVSVLGSSSLEISTNFDYEELLNRVIKIDKILQTQSGSFNNFIKLHSSEIELINNLNNTLLKHAYDSLINNDPIDFYHPDIFHYLISSNVRFINKDKDCENIPLGHSLGFLGIMKVLLEKKLINSSSEKEFKESLIDCYGGFTNNDDEFLNDRTLVDWINGEVEFDGSKYFKLDNSWYIYKEGFESNINRYFTDINYENLKASFELSEWNQKTYKKEGDYNLSYKDKDNFIVADKALISNLEICDIIKLENNKIYLCHVKNGLGRDLRVLINQIVNASRILTNAIKEKENSTLKKYFESISKIHYDSNDIVLKNVNGGVEKIDIDKFISLFKEREISFVFVYGSDSTKDIKSEIVNSKSFISKLSIIYCIRDMKLTDFNFYINRIKTIPEKNSKKSKKRKKSK